MKKLLCIGGPLDGKYYAHNPNTLQFTTVVNSGLFLSVLKGYTTERHTTNHTYYTTVLHRSPDGIETAVYRHNSLSFQEAAQRLISRYVP